jgi:hypothetical protein
MHSRIAVWVSIGLGLVLAARPASAQQALSMEGGARVAALAGAGTALPGSAWGWGNPAGSATLGERAVSFYATQGFGLSELRLGAARYAEPTAWGTFAAGARTFGHDAYRETVFSLGYARSFQFGTSRGVQAGLTARYYRLSLGSRSDGASYGSAGALALSLGAQVRLLPRLTLGAAAANVNAARYADGAELAQTLAVGLAFRASDRLLVLADAFKDVDHALSGRAGLEFVPVEALAVRLGVAGAPARVTAGVGLRLSVLRARLAFERHRTLGWTPAAGLAVRW